MLNSGSRELNQKLPFCHIQTVAIITHKICRTAGGQDKFLLEYGAKLGCTGLTLIVELPLMPPKGKSLIRGLQLTEVFFYQNLNDEHAGRVISYHDSGMTFSPHFMIF